MLSIEQFVKTCTEHIEKKEHFIAYRHPNGFGLLLTNQPYISYKVEGDSTGIHNKETKRERAPKALVNKMRRIIAQMYKDPRCRPLYVVEYDEMGLVTEGGDELYALPAVPRDE